MSDSKDSSLSNDEYNSMNESEDDLSVSDNEEEDKGETTSNDINTKEDNSDDDNNNGNKSNDDIENKIDILQKKMKNKGIVYISRVPPGMKSSQLKSILSNFCTVERIWCTGNDIKKSKKQRRGPSEAWVEISSEKKAKKIAKLLNRTPIGVGRYKEDLWTIKFLPGVKWHHLTIQHLHKQKMREQRLKKNIADAKKKTNFFLQQREKQFHEERVKERKRKRGDVPETDDDKLDEKKIKRTYQQKQVIVKNDEYDDDLLMKVCNIFLKLCLYLSNNVLLDCGKKVILI